MDGACICYIYFFKVWLSAFGAEFTRRICIFPIQGHIKLVLQESIRHPRVILNHRHGMVKDVVAHDGETVPRQKERSGSQISAYGMFGQRLVEVSLLVCIQ